MRKDYWRLVRRRLRDFQFFFGERLVNHRKVAISKSTSSNILYHHKIIEITDIGTSGDVSGIPELLPLSSYRFRLGYPVLYYEENERDLTFTYMPISDDFSETNELLTESTTIEVTGTSFLPLQITPSRLDFGFQPAESFDTVERTKFSSPLPYGVTARQTARDIKSLCLNVTNKSRNSQTLSLEKISSEFSIQGLTWTIPGSESIQIPVEFHPPREQTKYLCSALFTHQYGKIEIGLSGIGASADVVCDNVIDFGTLRLDSGGSQTFKIHNRGILPCSWELDIVQSSNEFSLADGDPYEAHGTIGIGKTIEKTINCKCHNKSGAAGHVAFRWKKVPYGQYELTLIPLQIQIGYPEFKIHSNSVDFGATYIGINKTMKLYIHNDGNASCNWKLDSDSSLLTMDKISGILLPGTTETIKVKYSPLDYEILDSSLTFSTDAGFYKVLAFGLVGVPYLKIVKENRMIDFGLLTIGKRHHVFLDVANTGKKSIDYEIQLLEMKRGSVVCKNDDFEFFFVDPSKGTIASGDIITLKFSAYPKDYAVIYEAKFVIRGHTGEEHYMSARAVGGQAIIKIKPPKVTGSTQKLTLIAQSEVRPFNKHQIAPQVPAQETLRFLMKSHIDTLYDLLGGLRAAEYEIKESISCEIDPKNLFTSPNADPSQETNFSEFQEPAENVEVTEKSKLEMEQIAAVEKELEMAIAKLDSTGSFSSVRFTPPSRGKDASKPSTASTPASREYGSYQPGKRVRRSREGEATVTSPDKPDVADKTADIFDPKGILSKPSTAKDSKPPSRKEPSPKPAVAQKATSKTAGTQRGPLKDENGNDVKTENEVQHRKSYKILSDKEAVKKESDVKKNGEGGNHDIFEAPLGETIHKSSTVPPITQVSDETKLIVFTDVRQQTVSVEDMISIAHALGLNVGQRDESEIVENVTAFQSTIYRFLDATKDTMKNVKEKMISETWIPNRELLHQAHRKLQISRVAIENLMRPIQETQDTEESNFYNLDLVCGGERSQSVLLFSLPNEGNIPFNYRIVPSKSDVSSPKNAKVGVNEFFSIENSQGILNPSDSINISASFFALATGNYRQGFILKSGDDEILSFALGAAVGNPNLTFSTEIIEFGLIGKLQSVTKQFIIKNTGSYEGVWDLDLDQNCFKVSPLSGKTAISSNSIIIATFTAPGEGAFTGSVKMNWKEGPTLLTLKGLGGAPKLAFILLTPEDRAFKGLDFGSCVVGMRYEKKLGIKNSGTMETVVEFAHPNSCVYFSVVRNDSGEFRLAPGDSAEVTIIYIPERIENLKDPVSFVLGNPRVSTQTLITKGRSGTQSMDAEGVLDFINVPIYEWQSKSIRLKNTGSFDLPLKIRWDPPEMQSRMESEYEDWVTGANLLTGKEMSITLKAQSSIAEHFSGTLFCSTMSGGNPKEFSFPFAFKSYTEEVTAQICEDLSIGRVVAGEVFRTEQVVTNNTNHRIFIRAKIVNADGTDEFLDWSLEEEGTEGVLEPNGHITITALFKAIAGRGEKWQNANLIIEKRQESSEEWSIFSQVGLKAALGEAKLEMSPTSLNFDEVALGDSNVLSFCLRNPGSALCTFELIPEYAYPKEFAVEGLGGLIGSIPDGGSLELSIRFTPSFKGFCGTDIVFKSPAGSKTLAIAASGQELKLFKDTIPKLVDFKNVSVGEMADKEILIENGCNMNIELRVALRGEGDDDISRYLKILPSFLKIRRNDGDNER